MVKMNCPTCGSLIREVTVGLEEFHLSLILLVCKNCGHLDRVKNYEEIETRLRPLKGDSTFALPPYSNETFHPIYLLSSFDRYIYTLKLIPRPENRKLTVLDVGASPGYLTRILQQLLENDVYGLDCSSILGIYFQDYVEDMKKSGIVIKDCNVDEDTFPFANDTFDFVIFEEVIEHLGNPQHALREINRVLKHKNGRVILTTPNFMRIGNVVRFLLKKPLRFHGVKEYTTKEIKKLLQDSNFTIEEIRCIDWSKKWLEKTLRTPQHSIFTTIWMANRYNLSKVISSLSAYMLVIAGKK